MGESISRQDAHFFYGRVRADKGVADMFLSRDGVIATKDENGAVQFTVHVYANNRDEALPLVENLKALANEFKGLAKDMQRYIDCFDFTRPGGTGDQEECHQTATGLGARQELETLPEPRSV